MHCVRKIKEDLYWVGADDRRLAMFEGVYLVPKGVSYNSYLLLDDKTVLFDSVDKAVEKTYIENVKKVLGDRKLDYLVIHHMEPDHSATVRSILALYEDVTIVCNKRSQDMLFQFLGDSYMDKNVQMFLVDEGDTLKTGHHALKFILAPMVHWPEVMVSYDESDGILFSADAFGTFGALNGAIYADEVDFARDYLKEARRYYSNIIGKYGMQVQMFLNKIEKLKINMICPLHGFIWRENIDFYIEKYNKWSKYEPEVKGVMIAYASIYGNTENAANILACRLCEKGVKTVMFDVSVTPSSEIIAAAFEYSHLVFASTTYNGGIFISMEELIRDLLAHGLKNRVVAIMENGSWAPQSGRLMREILQEFKDFRLIDNVVTIKSSLLSKQVGQIEEIAEIMVDSIRDHEKL